MPLAMGSRVCLSSTSRRRMQGSADEARSMRIAQYMSSRGIREAGGSRGPAVVLVAHVGVGGVICARGRVKHLLDGQHNHQHAGNGDHDPRVKARPGRQGQAGQVVGGCRVGRAGALQGMQQLLEFMACTSLCICCDKLQLG